MRAGSITRWNIKMATATLSTQKRILLENVSWQEYEEYLREYDERPIRLTYDRGTLEIMILSQHAVEGGKKARRYVSVQTKIKEEARKWPRRLMGMAD